MASLTGEVRAGRLSFPDAVAAECRAYLGDGICTVWVEAVMGSRRTGAVPHSMATRALSLCPGLVDADQPGVQAQPEVGALVCHLRDQGIEVVIVTNDTVAMTERVPLVNAAPLLGALQIDVQTYLVDLGFGAALGLLTV